MECSEEIEKRGNRKRIHTSLSRFLPQVHLCQKSDMPDHCISYAMSDPKDGDFQAKCDHRHNGTQLSPDMKEQWAYDVSTAEQAILAWKAHLVRGVNQDKARIEVIDDLDSSSVLLVQDWAMKFLPRKYRESQTDWFGKRGIPWHVTVAIRKRLGLEMMTFVHIFPACSQDSRAVLAIMSDVMQQLKVAMPDLKKVFYRQDNAGCYHSSTTIVGARVAAEKHQLVLGGMDFSDPQGGKGACDRKAATIKSHVHVHLNSGHDVETPQQLNAAIQSDGGIPCVRVALYESPGPRSTGAPKWEGISLLSNFRHEETGIRVWKGYKVGPGKLVPWERVNAPLPKDLPVIAGNSPSPNLQFAPVKSRHVEKAKSEVQVKESEMPQEPRTSDALFVWPEEGCVSSFLRLTALQEHLVCERHTRRLEYETSR